MLRYLLYEWLYLSFREQYPVLDPLNVFRYITFRTAMASATAVVLTLLVGSWFVGVLRRWQIGQQIRTEGPESHQAKRGTPTMGGVLMIFAVVVSTLLWGDLSNSRVWLAMASLLLFGAIGFADDYTKVVKKQSLGWTGRQKITAQVAISLALGMALIYWLEYSTVLSVPFFKTFRPELPKVVYLLFLLFVVVGASNAVNLTDGLDGLAVGVSFITISALTAFTYVTSHHTFATYLAIEHMGEVGELTVFCGALAGACLGFLWYNAPPADVFMGDVGSLALGGTIGLIAVMIKQEMLLAMIGGVFVIEAVSVMIQVMTFKVTKRLRGHGYRVFRMSPLHHHFELLGWKETKVVFRFLIIAILFALLSLSTLKLR